MLFWACAGVPLGAYNVSEHFNIALQIQPQILTVLSLITWIQCYYYNDVSLVWRWNLWESSLSAGQKWSVSRCCLVVGVIGAIFGGVEAGLVFALKVRSASMLARLITEQYQGCAER